MNKKVTKKRRMSKQQKEFLSIVPGFPMGVQVVDGDLSYALRAWKKKVKESGVLRDIFNNREFEKPSLKRRRTKLDAIYKQQRKLERQYEKEIE